MAPVEVTVLGRTHRDLLLEVLRWAIHVVAHGGSGDKDAYTAIRETRETRETWALP